jgi:hypothetical protein
VFLNSTGGCGREDVSKPVLPILGNYLITEVYPQPCLIWKSDQGKESIYITTKTPRRKSFIII